MNKVSADSFCNYRLLYTNSQEEFVSPCPDVGGVPSKKHRRPSHFPKTFRWN